MSYLFVLLIYLTIQVKNVAADGLPTRVKITLKLNIKNRTYDPKICTTASCNKTARELLKYVDLKSDPCTDFYQFCCGNFMKNELPPGKRGISLFQELGDVVNRDLKDILEGELAGIKLNFAKQTKLAFQTCVNTGRIERSGVQAIKNVLNKFGGWPIIEEDDWKEEKCNLSAIITELQTYELVGIFRIIVNPFRITTTMILPPDLTLPDDTYNETSTLWNSYRQFITNVSLYIGEMEKSEKLMKDVDDIIDVEGRLDACVRIKATSIDDVLNMTTLETLSNIFGNVFDIESLLKSIYKLAALDLDSTERIGIYSTPYLRCMVKLLETTSKRKVVNYLLWFMIKQVIIAMPNQIVEFENIFNAEIGRSSSNMPRWETCVELVNEKLHDAVGYLYTIRHFSHTKKIKVLKLIQRLKVSFRTLILSNKWLSKESRDAMTQKLDQMIDRVGYPDYLDDPRFLEHHFTGVEFSGLSFLETLLTMNKLKLKESLRELRIPINSDLMRMPITIINAMYQEYPNIILFPAAILLPPFYDDSYPMNLNFGSIGSIIGHEITHGFDNFRSQVSLNGSVIDIWQGKDVEEFNKKAVCMINQFNELVEPQIKEKVNGNLTNREDIADMGGLRIAYLAYKTWLRENGKEKQLPGFPYNSEQMFFIAYGLKFCRKLNDKLASLMIKRDPHAPNIFRINMSLKNLKSFSKVFKCKADSEMNLSDRCKVW